MTRRYFDDLSVGDVFESQGKTVSESEILEFALKYDPQPFHMDVEAARESIYGGLIASGFQTLALAFRMLFQEGVFTGTSLGSPGMDELRWVKPVYPGDTIRNRGEVIELKPSRSKPDRGMVRVRYTVLNQDDEPVMTLSALHILSRRPES